MAATHQAAEMQGRPRAAASDFHRQMEVRYLSRDVQDSEGDVGLQSRGQAINKCGCAPTVRHWTQRVLLCASVCQTLGLAEERSEPSLVLRVPTCGTGKERNLISGVWDCPLTSDPIPPLSHNAF